MRGLSTRFRRAITRVTWCRRVICCAIPVLGMLATSDVRGQTPPKQATPIAPIKYVMATVNWNWDSDCSQSGAFWMPVEQEQADFFVRVVASNTTEHHQMPEQINAYLRLLRSDKVPAERKALATRPVCGAADHCVLCNPAMREYADRWRQQVQARVDEIAARRDALYREALPSLVSARRSTAEAELLLEDAAKYERAARLNPVTVTDTESETTQNVDGKTRTNAVARSREVPDPELSAKAEECRSRAARCVAEASTHRDAGQRLINQGFAIDQETKPLYQHLKQFWVLYYDKGIVSAGYGQLPGAAVAGQTTGTVQAGNASAAATPPPIAMPM